MYQNLINLMVCYDVNGAHEIGVCDLVNRNCDEFESNYT